MVTLGCARNEVDSEELAARLEQAGWTLADDADDADVVLVNTCGFIQAAKQDSIDELLGAAGGGAAVVAAGCLAERYGSGLAEALPEAQVLSFDDYGNIADRLDDVVAGRRWQAHEPRDRRQLLPLTPAARPAGRAAPLPGHGTVAASPAAAPAPAFPTCRPAWRPPPARGSSGGGSAAGRRRRSRSPRAATGGAASAPSRRSAARSSPGRPPTWSPRPSWLAGHGVRELFLVSENSTSYGKDLGDLRLLETLLPQLAAVAAASPGSGSATCSRPRSGPAWSRSWPARRAWRRTSTCRSSTPAARCCGRCAGSATASGSAA